MCEENSNDELFKGKDQRFWTEQTWKLNKESKLKEQSYPGRSVGSTPRVCRLKIAQTDSNL